MTDVELLEQHRAGDDSAFTNLVRRHLGWVYGMARRRLRDSHSAEDVAQAVFILLHRKAPHFPADGALIRWLHKTTWYATEAAARTERRRRKRESEVAAMHPATTNPSSDHWEELAPLLDRLIERLSPTDREAILLRYFRDMSFAEVAAQIGTTEDTARKRVERAITKLRDFACAKGVEISASALTLNLTNHIVTSPPAGLIAATTGAATAPAGSALVSTIAPITKGAVLMMTSAKLTVVGFAAAAVLIVGGGVWIALPSHPTAGPAPVAATPAAVALTDVPPRAKPSWAVDNSFPKVSPFSGIRWRDTTAEVLVNGTWYEWIALNDQTAAQIIAAAHQLDPGSWQKRVNEDLVELMAQMGHQPGTTVSLQLRNLGTNEVVTLQDVAMTEANRQAIWLQTNQAALPMPLQANRSWGATNSFPKLAPFSSIRWQGTTPQVRVDGTWYEWVALDGLPVTKIVEDAQKLDPKDWQKRINEDLVELLARMDHPTGQTVSLDLRDLTTGQTTTLPTVAMTAENRSSIMTQGGKP